MTPLIRLSPRQVAPTLTGRRQALEPNISKQIMELHHSKHHQAYVTNLNKAVQAHAAAVQANDIPAQVALQPAMRFNGGGHINHSLFWQNLAPAASPDAADPRAAAASLVADIEATWGSLGGFRDAFSAALLGIQGSGWGWLVKEEGTGRLRIVTTKDQDPVVGGEVPILGIDMWEHAYYLQVSELLMSWLCGLEVCLFGALTCGLISISTAKQRMLRMSGTSSTGRLRRRDTAAVGRMLSES